MGNLFQQAAGAAKTTKPRNDKEEIILSSDMFEGTPGKKREQALEVSAKMERLYALEETIASAEAEKKGLESEIKAIGKTQFVAILAKLGKRVTSFVMRTIKIDANGMEVPSLGKLVIFQDRYKKLDAERYEYLAAEYGPEIVEQKTTYTLDAELIEKYGEELSKLIMGSKVISDIDKGRLIAASVDYVVRKGTIEKLPTFAADKIPLLLEEIAPIQQLKDSK